jgi:cell division protein FtsA
MNGTAEYIMAFDLGSSRIVAALGKKSVNGELRVLAVEQRPVDADIRHGVVHNIEEVASKVRELKEALCRSQMPELAVNHVYVSINGYTLRTKELVTEANYDGTTIFSENELDELADQIPSSIPEGFCMINFYQQEFLVDGKLDKNPVGSMPKHVKAVYKLVGAREDVVNKTEAAFKSIKLTCCTSLGPVATAEAVLTQEEKNKGVVCLDFGSETTSVCVYKGDIIRYVAVLPFGGRNLTLDLLQLNMDEDDAEKIKLEKGDATHYSELEEKEEEVSMTRELCEINDIFVARIEEIVENIWVQINRSGVEPAKLLSGIVMTGGASRLPNLDKLLKRKTGLSVRTGLPVVQLESDSARAYGKLELARCIGLLLQGKDGSFHKPVQTAVEQKLEFYNTDETESVVKLENLKEEAPKKKEKKTKVPIEDKPKVVKESPITKMVKVVTRFLNEDN